ncbi:hypothetical protein D7I43_28415 [Micromonospora globbae]|jgi:hypothetical protein|uniref:Uncharacterized protein n=1 Tax=Micromonospora globbae TaxID=1894969 RepID=A0A420ETU3_9ACTN|nr:hypothetical protein D7I43_28415 [Micromonospora globbae]
MGPVVEGGGWDASPGRTDRFGVASRAVDTFQQVEKRYAVVVLSLAALLTACGGSTSPDEQMEYLRSMARQGAELHAVDKGRGSAGDQEECAASYEHIYGGPRATTCPTSRTSMRRPAY